MLVRGCSSAKVSGAVLTKSVTSHVLMWLQLVCIFFLPDTTFAVVFATPGYSNSSHTY